MVTARKDGREDCKQVLESEMGGVKDREIALARHWMRSGRAREADGLPLEHGCG